MRVWTAAVELGQPYATSSPLIFSNSANHADAWQTRPTGEVESRVIQDAGPARPEWSGETGGKATPAAGCWLLAAGSRRHETFLFVSTRRCTRRARAGSPSNEAPLFRAAAPAGPKYSWVSKRHHRAVDERGGSKSTRRGKGGLAMGKARIL
ncbi:hypothetical protein BCV70DRAFT_198201 [Testicularia cyperi]|uniref:Uncharacterized protein n=1 Tax=Testicularia cyperi TaxID=1882483 RepID=A0A317XU85_9BASI|nr:hypothetical protein BCV70DRAFT_198201 [Testicularia cyperi]